MRPHVYVSFRLLPPSCQPCHIYRTAGVTLIYVDPRTQRPDLVPWVVDNTTTDELNVLRRAYGEPAVGEPISDFWFEAGTMSYIPSSLRLPQEAHIAHISPTTFARTDGERQAG